MSKLQPLSIRRPLRLLVVSYSLHGGGAERFTSTLLNHLDIQRFEPRLCLVRGEFGYPLREGIPVSVLDKRQPWHLPRTLWRLRQLIIAQEPDIVLTTIAYTAQLVAAALLGLPKRPCWIARIGDDPSTSDKGLQRRLYGKIYPMADHIVTNSEGLRQSFIRCYPAAGGKVVTIYNPTDFAHIDQLAAEEADIKADPKLPVIISVGRLSPQKQPELLIDAFHRLRSRKLAAELWICGEGPLKATLQRDIQSRGLAESVKFLGFRRNPYSLMRQAAVFAMTSKHEGLPNALIEAQGLGLPAVSTRCPHGPSEIIEPGQTGYLTGIDDVDGLSEAMQRLLNSYELRNKMARAARIRARSLFNQSSLIRNWENLLVQTYQIKSKITDNSD